MLWNLNFDQLMLSFSFICCAAFIAGWFADKILGYSGFNVIGNWLILLIGAYAGMYAYNVYGFRFSVNVIQTILVTSGAAFSTLILSLMLKLALRA